MKQMEKLLDLKPAECLQVDAVFHLVLGVALFAFPNLVLQAIISDSTDGVHWHIARCLGAQMVAEAIVWWYIAKSNHVPAQTSCLLARILGSALWIAVSLHCRAFYSKNFTAIALPLVAGSCFIFLLINIRQLLKSGWEIGRQLWLTNSHLFNCLIQCDAFAALVIGIMWISFPDWILSRQVSIRLTGTHLYLGRCLGAIFVSTHVLSAQALYWQHLESRNMWAYGRALMCAGILLAQIWSQTAYGQWWDGNHWVGITLFSSWTFLVLWAVGNVKSGKFQ